MDPNIKIETELWKCSTSTIRVWLVLIELTKELGNPLILSFTEVSKYSNVSRRVSPRAVSNALKELERLNMVKVDRRGNISVITIKGLSTKSPLED